MPEVGTNMGMLPFNVPDGINVRPSKVVKLSPLEDFAIQECGTAEMPFGISQNWVQGAPGTPYDDGFVSRSTNPAVMVWAPGSIAIAAQKANAPFLSPGDSVGADSNADLVFVTSGWAVGWVLESGASAATNVIRIFVFPHHRGGGSD